MKRFTRFLLCLLISCLFFSAANSQSIDVQRTLNGNINLSCNFKSNDVLSYKWYIDGKLIGNPNVTIEKNSTMQTDFPDKLIQSSDKNHRVRGNELIVAKVKGTHYYKCEIELTKVGAKFAVSKKIDSDSKLNRNKRQKNEELKFTAKMAPNKNFDLGSTGKIHCRASGSNNIYWRRNQDEELPSNVEDVNGTLNFYNVDVSMKGSYTCFAANDSGQKISHQIEVRILPAFEVTPPEEATVDEQQSIILDCVGSGAPIVIKWDFETKIIEPDDVKFKIYENGSLLIHDAKSDDGGHYGCTIGNSAGFKRSETLLTVKQLAESDTEEASSVFSNKAVLITCSLAIIYIIGVIVLMIWCRRRRGNKQDNETDPEQLKLNEENDHTNDEKPTPSHKNVAKSLSSSFAFDIKYEKIAEMTKIGSDSNLKMEILTGFVGDSDLPHKLVTKDSNVADEIRMQQQTKVLVRTIKRDHDEKSVNEFRRLVDLYCKIDSENVVKLLGLSKEPKIYGMILEHNDDMRSYLVAKEDASLSELLKYCHQLANGISAIHAVTLTHRDISLSNCIITKENTLKLTSKTPTESADYCEYNGYMLPLRHSAPEIVMGCKNKSDLSYSFASDIYACGVTIWEILNRGSQPFKSLTKDDLIKKLLTKSLDYNLLEVESVPADVNEIMMKCLKGEACDRIDCGVLMKSLEEAIAKTN